MINTLHKYLHKNNLRGKDKLYKILKKIGFQYKVFDQTDSGIKMYLDPNNYIDSFILKNGSYEQEVSEELASDVDADTVIWDIGANIGFHSLTFKKKYPQNIVFSFEPDYRNFMSLKRNQKLNNLDINLMNFALSDKFSCQHLFSMDGNHGMSTITPWHEFNWNKYPHYILCTSGDFLINNNIAKSPTILKIDVEGHELMVLKGLENTITKKSIKKIIFETDNNFLKCDSEIKSFLNLFGYRYFKLQRNDAATSHSLSNFVAYLN
ncbi:FkbM family methyltransferase [Agrobacterium tumefaciens]|nr:FkbM family methyltransferase [Agrobacterium tumefaciens]NTE18922.1 FkbM family methyltransferase [Agrobacterium tumefaciens]